MLRYVLNQHPQIYCSFESGIMLILREIAFGKTTDAAEAVVKGPHVHLTFSYAKDAFRRYENTEKSGKDTRSAFYEVLNLCRENRSGMAGEGGEKRDLAAVGEKNPFEHANPPMNGFIRDVHPDAKFIHLVRHPVAFAKSRLRHVCGMSAVRDRANVEEGLNLWVRSEQWVLSARKNVESLTIRYEDLCGDPELWVRKLYRFLVPGTEASVREGAGIINVNGNEKYNLAIQSDDDALLRLMSMYGYRSKK